VPWRRNVEGFTGAQVHTRHQDVDVRPPPLFEVLHGGQVHVLPVQAGKGQRLEVVQHSTDLVGTGRFFV
jgi:predicted TIM-barrel fold metal-dependent hydrolase